MTSLDVTFGYDAVPGERELRALDSVREVYGIRKIAFNEKQKTVRVEFDASRFKADEVTRLLLQAGLDLTAPVALASVPK
jgi:hypothetical protein